MQKSSMILITLSILTSTLFLNSANAGDLEWSGVYRIEGNHLNNSELGSKHKELGYGLQHLVLRPKIVVGDGLTIYGQFNILNDSTNYPGSQMGQSFGSGVGGTHANQAARDGTSSTADSNSTSSNQKAATLEVSQLYLTFAHEYGSLIAGRAPLHFGLGMTHNAGRGLFDHWYDTSDMVGYKFVVGNLYFLPMFGKPSEGQINNNSDDVSDFMIQVQYENPETDIELGAFYQLRKGADQASDAPPTPVGGGGTATNMGSIDTKLISIYALRDSERFRLGLEASFQSGESGLLTAPGGDNVAWDGFGIAFEAEYRPLDSAWKWGLKAGSATGDDPATNAKYEGFIFDRNYDVAMLMFNHPLGRADFLSTNLVRGDVFDANGNINKADVEAISNVLYIAPSARYTLSDKWSLDNTIITGFTATNAITGKDVASDLGYEWDISLNYMPRKGVMWVNQAGFLFPGDAWKAEDLYDSSFGFGLATKAAISF